MSMSSCGAIQAAQFQAIEAHVHPVTAIHGDFLSYFDAPEEPDASVW